jgi:hypothetical protein
MSSVLPQKSVHALPDDPYILKGGIHRIDYQDRFRRL